MDYEVKINYKYDEGDYVKCKELRGDNVEGLIRSEVYEVMGVSMQDGNVIYAVRSQHGDMKYSMDVFEKVGERGNSIEYDTPMPVPVPDMVNHPSHYKYAGFEVIDIIDGVMEELGDGREGYYIGNALKYLMRQHKKNGLQDVEKAVWYLKRLLESSDDGQVTYHEAESNPSNRAINIKQIGYIAGLTEDLEMDRYELPEYISPLENYKLLTEAEASKVIDKLLAIKNYKRDYGM